MLASECTIIIIHPHSLHFSFCQYVCVYAEFLLHEPHCTVYTVFPLYVSRQVGIQGMITVLMLRSILSLLSLFYNYMSSRNATFDHSDVNWKTKSTGCLLSQWYI